MSIGVDIKRNFHLIQLHEDLADTSSFISPYNNFGFTIYYQNYLQFLGNISQIIPFLPLIGLVNLVKLITDWRKEITLEFGDVITKEKMYFINTDYTANKIYCLTIKKSGVGESDNSEGELKVEGIDKYFIPTIWHDEESKSIPITIDEKHLRLFEFVEKDNQKKIQFYSSSKDKRAIPYNDENLNRKLIVRIGSKNAKKPLLPWEKKISEIIGKN